MNVTINIRIEADTPIHIGSGLGISGIIDRALTKDGESNVYIPGSTIKGRVKYNYTLLCPFLLGGVNCIQQNTYCKKEDLKKCCAICQIFGSKLHHGLFIFRDAALIEQGFQGLPYRNRLKTIKDFKHMQTLTRRGVKISRQRKVAEEKKLFSIETSSPYFIYETDISGIFYPVNELKSTIPPEVIALILSIRRLNKIGGNKSRGLGSVGITIKSVNIDNQIFDEKGIDNIFLKHLI